jgi:hypothetical protein
MNYFSIQKAKNLQKKPKTIKIKLINLNFVGNNGKQARKNKRNRRRMII